MQRRFCDSLPPGRVYVKVCICKREREVREGRDGPGLWEERGWNGKWKPKEREGGMGDGGEGEGRVGNGRGEGQEGRKGEGQEKRKGEKRKMVILFYLTLALVSVLPSRFPKHFRGLHCSWKIYKATHWHSVLLEPNVSRLMLLTRWGLQRAGLRTSLTPQFFGGHDCDSLTPVPLVFKRLNKNDFPPVSSWLLRPTGPLRYTICKT